MSTTSSESQLGDLFSALSQHHESPEQLIALAITHFRKSRQAMELFEALKMQVRHRLGLPLIPGESDEVPESVERELESGLLSACREAGRILVEDGQIDQGWMYLRPVADQAFARQLFENIQIDEDNYDDMVQVLLHEGLDVGRGYQALLKHQGTCNGVTMYEQSIAGRNETDRKAAAAVLLDHFYQELTEMVRDDIARRDEQNPETNREDGTAQDLGEMLSTRPWLLEEGGYHLDTTHLSATVRIAAVLDDPEQWERASHLAHYGRKLHHEFQYPGEEPFVDFYPAYTAFYDILLGKNVEAGLNTFQRKAKTVDASVHGTQAIETYIDLLDRIGRSDQAVHSAIELTPEDVPPQRILATLLKYALKSREISIYDKIMAYCQHHEDVLGYAATAHAKAARSAATT